MLKHSHASQLHIGLMDQKGKTMKWNALRTVLSKTVSLYYYARLRHPKRWGWLPSDEKEVVDGLCDLGIPVQEFVVNVDQYKVYFDRAEYSSRYPGYPGINCRDFSYIFQKMTINSRK